MELHSTDDPNDDIIDVPTQGQKPFEKLAKELSSSNNNETKKKEDDLMMLKNHEGELCHLRDKSCKTEIKLET